MAGWNTFGGAVVHGGVGVLLLAMVAFGRLVPIGRPRVVLEPGPALGLVGAAGVLFAWAALEGVLAHLRAAELAQVSPLRPFEASALLDAVAGVLLVAGAASLVLAGAGFSLTLARAVGIGIFALGILLPELQTGVYADRSVLVLQRGRYLRPTVRVPPSDIVGVRVVVTYAHGPVHTVEITPTLAPTILRSAPPAPHPYTTMAFRSASEADATARRWSQLGGWTRLPDDPGSAPDKQAR